MSTRRIIATYAFVMFFLVIALLGTVTAIRRPPGGRVYIP